MNADLCENDTAEFPSRQTRLGRSSAKDCTHSDCIYARETGSRLRVSACRVEADYAAVRYLRPSHLWNPTSNLELFPARAPAPCAVCFLASPATLRRNRD